MDIHVFPIPIPPPTSLSTRSLWVFPVHQARALVSCIQPGLNESEVAQPCPALCDCMDCSLPGSSVHGIFQARILKWVAISFSRDLPTQGSNLGFLRCQFSSVAQSCPTLCDPMNCNMPGLPVHHKLPEFTQTHAHRVGDAIQPSYPLSSPSLPALQADALLSELPGKPNKENTSSLSLRRITHLYLPCLSLNFSF